MERDKKEDQGGKSLWALQEKGEKTGKENGKKGIV